MSGLDEWAGGDAEDAVRLPWSDVEEPCMGVVRAVAAVTDRETLELPPIDDTVDCDALNTLLRRGDDQNLRLRFTYAATTVVIVRGAFIEVRPAA